MAYVDLALESTAITSPAALCCYGTRPASFHCV